MASPLRLHKFMSASGIASLRASEGLISDGRVLVNGVPAVLGARVIPGKDVVEVVQQGSGERRVVDVHPSLLPQRATDAMATAPFPSKWQYTYLALNKPRGVITSVYDPEGRPCLLDIVRQPVNRRVLVDDSSGEAKLPTRLMHVGRLDFNTSGLLLLTDHGLFAQAVTHPKHCVAKRYEVSLPRARVGPEGMEDVVRQLQEGVQLEDGPARADEARVLPHSTLTDGQPGRHGEARPVLQLTIHDGRNRVVRRMLQACGFPAIALVRTAIGGIALRPSNGLPPLLPGRMRRLTGEEVEDTLSRAHATSGKAPEARGVVGEGSR